MPSGAAEWGRIGHERMRAFLAGGAAEDLDAAVKAFKQALAATGAGDVEYYRHALDLSWACESRFDRFGARGQQYMVAPAAGGGEWRGPRDLVLPILVLDALLGPGNQRPPAPAEMVPRLQRNLANLLARYSLRVRRRPAADRLRDLRRAVSLLEQALGGAQPESEDELTIASSLLAALEQAQAAEEAADLPAGAADADPLIRKRALDALSSGAGDRLLPPPIRVRVELNRASELLRVDDVDGAVSIWRALATAAAGGSEPPALALEAAATWAVAALARGRLDEVAEAWSSGREAAERLWSAQRSWVGRYDASRRAGALAAAAAVAFGRRGDADRAVEVLEEGRALLLTELSWRRRPGDRSNVAGGGAIVHLLAAAGGGLALVSGATGGARSVVLSGLGDDLLSEVMEYAKALDAFRRQSDMGFDAWNRRVSAMTGLLAGAFEPLVVALPEGAVTLVPVGVLAFLPVASALVVAGGGARAVGCLPAMGLAGAPAAGVAGAALVVSDPSLSSAPLEASAVRSFFGAGEPPGPAPSGAAEILAAIPAGGVAHFACHATIEVGRPLDGAVVLPGGERLTVARILEADLPAGATIVLSACETALPDPYGLDEGITFAGAFLAAGAGAVISTLWLVDDVSSALLMLRFYWEWRRQGHPAALALARAQEWLRTTSDGATCKFVELDLPGQGLLDEGPAAELAGRVRERSRSSTGNAFADPYYWAGIQYSGR